MRWMLRTGIVLAILASAAWIFRVDIVLFSVSRAIGDQSTVGPSQTINWSTGADPEGRDPNERPPNIVLILADDLGWNDISMNGPNPTTQTPNIDALAADGVTFTQGYAANGTCAPSRAALMSGRYGTRFGFEFTPTPPGMTTALRVMDDSGERPLQPASVFNDAENELSFDEMGMPRSEITIAELLREQGYHTVHIGKWHLGRSNGMAAHDQGFTESLLMSSGLYGLRNDEEIVQARQSFDPIDRFLWAALRFAASYNGGPDFEPKRYLTDYYTDEAVRVIEANKGRPFFLYLAHWAPHTPLQATREDYDALSDIELHRERVYAAMIRSLDRGVGQVMKALKENGLDQNTLVIFTSDNGGAGYIGLPDVNTPYRGWKITLFEGGIRVPFLAQWPAQLPAGVTYDAPVHHFDIYATAAAAGNTDLPSDRVVDGVDLTPYITGIDHSTPHDYLFFSAGAAQAVRDARWKLIMSAPQGGQRNEWLFDLKAYGERKNLLAENPDVAARLRDALVKHISEQAESRWPWGLTTAINVDRDLARADQPEDEFAYWSN